MNETLDVDNSKLAEAPVVRWRKLAMEVCIRAASAFLIAAFAVTAFNHWIADPTRITLLFMVAAESLTVCLALLARVPAQRDWHLYSIFCSLAATYYFIAIQLAPGTRLIPEFLGVALQIAGLLWQIYAKLSLRLSFGLLPANRGIVTSGAYRFTRHPMYFGYFITHMGFLLTNFGLQNLLVYVGLYSLQAVRVMREERLLSADPAYRTYCTQVRYRIVPGIF